MRAETDKIKRDTLFKVKTAAEAIAGDKNITEIAKATGVHPSTIRRWKKKAQSALLNGFSSKNDPDGKKRIPDADEHQKIADQLNEEINFLKRALERTRKAGADGRTNHPPGK
ncbi:MAG: transposase [Deltaproteobacteria bacterium]|nr:transposase [Deltaproteobacteria bacterium]